MSCVTRSTCYKKCSIAICEMHIFSLYPIGNCANIDGFILVIAEGKWSLTKIPFGDRDSKVST